MEEQTLITQIIQFILFLGISLLIIFVVQRIADVAINKYFKLKRKNAIAAGKTVNGKRYITLAAVFRKLVSALLWILLALAILQWFGVNIAFLLSGAGAIGIIFGIAGRDIIMDYYVGATVLVEDQYRIGDVIKISADHSGVVEEISLRTVVLRDIDGNVHVVPHSLAPSIINMTYDFSKVNIELGVAYDSDIDKVTKIINEVGAKQAEAEEWKELIIEPVSLDRILRFDESQITVRALGKVKAGKQWAISGDYSKRIKEAFDKNGIEIPFPQRVMHMVPEKHPKK